MLRENPRATTPGKKRKKNDLANEAGPAFLLRPAQCLASRSDWAGGANEKVCVFCHRPRWAARQSRRSVRTRSARR